MVDLRGKARSSAVKPHPDFKDPKYKVGHGKVKPQNETKVDFKHKRIVLAKQTGISDQITDPYLELFARCRHYAGKRRIEAFRELAGIRSEISCGMKSNYLSVVCMGISDEEKDVRKFAFTFFQEISDSSPSASASESLGLSLRAALSHMQSEIRSDALRLANSIKLGFLPEASAIEISRSLLERRLTPDTTALLLQIVRQVLLVRPTSSAQWTFASLQNFTLDDARLPLLASLVQKLSVPEDLKNPLRVLGVVVPEPEPDQVYARKRKADSLPPQKVFAVGGRGFAVAGFMDDDE